MLILLKTKSGNSNLKLKVGVFFSNISKVKDEQTLFINLTKISFLLFQIGSIKMKLVTPTNCNKEYYATI